MAKHRRDQGQGSVFQYPGCKRWVIQYYVDGRRKREATGLTSRQEAQKVLHARLVSVAKGEPITIKAVNVEACYPALLRSKKWINASQQKLAGLVMRWKHLQPFFGCLHASRITPAVCDQYRERRTAKGVTHATVDRELTYLRAMLRAAYKERTLATAPYIPLSGADNKRTGFASDAQLDALRQAATATGELWLRTVVELASECGTRRANLLELTVAQCDFEAGIVRLEKTKNGHALELPMTPPIRALLEQGCTGKKASDSVLTRNDGTVVRDPRVAWWALCCAAGLGKFVCRTNDCGTVQTSRKRCPQCHCYNWKYAGLLLHDLRRTAVRNLRQAGVSEQVAMGITGHKTPAVFKRYDIVNNDDKRTALQQLSEFKVALKTSRTAQRSQPLDAGNAVTTRVLQ